MNTYIIDSYSRYHSDHENNKKTRYTFTNKGININITLVPLKCAEDMLFYVIFCYFIHLISDYLFEAYTNSC